MNLFLLIEILAACFGVVCVYLQTREKILAWPFGIVSVVMLVIVFYRSSLYSDVLLHLIFMILNIYGWWYWSRHKSVKGKKSEIKLLNRYEYALWPLVIVAGTIGLGLFMGSQLGASLPYFDAFTTSGSLVAQYLLAKKVLQNWLLWIIVDVVAVGVYTYKGLYPTVILFTVFLILCIKGYIDWKKEFDQIETNVVPG